MAIATANSGRQRAPTDGLPQAARAAVLVTRAATWVRDDEAKVWSCRTTSRACCGEGLDYPLGWSGEAGFRHLGSSAGRSRFSRSGPEQLVDYRFHQSRELLLAPGGGMEGSLRVEAVGIGYGIDR